MTKFLFLDTFVGSQCQRLGVHDNGDWSGTCNSLDGTTSNMKQNIKRAMQELSDLTFNVNSKDEEKTNKMEKKEIGSVGKLSL